MNPIKGVLSEELSNSESMLTKYQQAINALPKGCIVDKEIKGHHFHYLAYREGKRIRFEYKGRLPEYELERFKEAKALRVKYRKLISDLRGQIVFIRRALGENRKRSIRSNRLEIPIGNPEINLISDKKENIQELCKQHHIKKFAIFGSVLRDDFRPESDIDVLVEFEPGHTPGFGFITIEDELSKMFGRKVDLSTPHSLSRYFRDRVLKESQVLYDAA